LLPAVLTCSQAARASRPSRAIATTALRISQRCRDAGEAGVVEETGSCPTQVKLLHLRAMEPLVGSMVAAGVDMNATEHECSNQRAELLRTRTSAAADAVLY
jgi:hypothetical protein